MAPNEEKNSGRFEIFFYLKFINIYLYSSIMDDNVSVINLNRKKYFDYIG